MVNGHDSSLQDKLQRAEEAESEVQRLGDLAAEAPHLRSELAKAQRKDERDRNRNAASEQARKEVMEAAEKQADVPLTLETVSKLVYSLYSLLKDVDANRRESTRLMAIVDRMDYEQELEEGREEQAGMGRDPKGLEYLIASRHGQSRIKRLVDDLDPNFSFLRNCELDEPLRRDVANFILAHVVAPEKATQDKPAPLPVAPQESTLEEAMAPIPVPQGV